MKIFDIPRFFKTMPLPTTPFSWEKYDRALFGEYCKNSTRPPIYKGGDSIMVAGLKLMQLIV